jgi:hypothetical protein
MPLTFCICNSLKLSGPAGYLPILLDKKCLLCYQFQRWSYFLRNFVNLITFNLIEARNVNYHVLPIYALFSPTQLPKLHIQRKKEIVYLYSKI